MSIYRRAPDEYRYFDPRANLKDRALERGINKEGNEYDRKVNYQKGYGELLDIVAGLQKDVKRINQCMTLPGAQAYVSKRKNWSAIEDDITGPNGKPDGIKEVLVFDAKGNLKVVNGYTLTASDYPYRKYYITKYPTAEDRRGHPFSDFVEKVKDIAWDPEQRKWTYKYIINEPEFQGLQPAPSPRALFKQEIFQPQYDIYRLDMKQGGFEPMLMARIYNKSLSEAYNQIIVRKVIRRHFDNLYSQGRKPTDKQVKKYRNTKDFKEKCYDLVIEILSSQKAWAYASLIAEWILMWHYENPTLVKQNAPKPDADWPSNSPDYRDVKNRLKHNQERVNQQYTAARLQPPVVTQPPVITEAQRQEIDDEDEDEE